MTVAVTSAGRELKRRLAGSLVRRLARGADRKLGVAASVLDALPFFPLTSEVGRALARRVAEGDSSLVAFMARLEERLSERALDKFVTNLLVNSWVEGRPIRERFRRTEGFYPPNFIVVSPTMRCNLSCPGCWAAMYEEAPHMEMELLERVVEECTQELGVRFFTIAGGEPFVRRDLLDLYERHDDCYFQIYTNGLLIDEEVASRLGELGNVAPMLSVEGGPSTTDRRRGPGTYARLVEVRRLLSDAGVLHGFAVTATRANAEEVTSGGFVDEMIVQGALAGWYFHYIPVGLSPDPSLMVTPEQREMMRRRIFNLRMTRPIFLADFWNDGPAVHGCMAGGKRYLHINPSGDVEPCVFVHFAVDNVRDKTLREALRHPFMAAIRNSIPYDGNLLRPCMIIDRPEILRQHCARYGATATHPGADTLVTELAAELDERAAGVAAIMNDVWNCGGWQHLYVTADELGRRRAERMRMGHGATVR